MNIFTLTLSFFIGICLIFCSEYFPVYDLKIFLLSLLAMCVLVWRNKNLKLAITSLLLVVLGFGYAQWHIKKFNDQHIPSHLEGKKILVIGKVKDVINKESSRTVIIQANNIYENKNVLPITPTLKLSIYKSNVNILPGQTWSMTVKVKQPRNYSNPGSFDIEKFMFASKIHAIGYVVGQDMKLLDSRLNPLDYVQGLRFKVANFIDQHNYKFGSIIKALSIGFNNLPYDQKIIFQNTGLAHILSISGLHVGFIAILIYQISKRLIANYNARIYVTILGAIIYSSLAGFSIPTQRALIMLCTLFSSKLLTRHVSSFNTLTVALLIIFLHDPLCILSVGFWLSFGAVIIILFLSAGDKKLNLIRFNILITLAMAPLTLLFFNKTPIISPLSNIIFVPVISTIIVPACFLGVILVFLNGYLANLLFLCINKFFAISWPLLDKFSHAPVFELIISNSQYVNLLIASLGIIYLLYPKKLPLKPLSVVCFLPLFLYHPPSIEYGELKFTQLDVGQGASSVIQTANHTLIYDAGPKRFGFDAGSQVIIPFLKHEHIKQIDLLIISHADNDHVGGAESLMANLPVKKLLVGESEKLEKYPLELCHRGQSWIFDEVKFEILHPDQFNLSKKRNDKSCVLKVTSKSNKVILIVGDIEKKSEKELLEEYQENDLTTDVLIAPHHGSKTSSSQEFLDVVKPSVAIFPTGYKNHYGHPKLETLNKYYAMNSMVLNTSYTGAVSFVTNDRKIKVSCYRQEHKKFWHKD